MEVERCQFPSVDRENLAAKGEWIAETCWDGVSFDVLSFDESNHGERYIEVKTTDLGKSVPFLVTANKVRCSKDRPV